MCLLPAGIVLIIVRLLIIVVLHLISLISWVISIILHIVGLVSHRIVHIIVVVIHRLLLRVGEFLLAALGIVAHRAGRIGPFQKVLIVEFSIIILFVINLFENGKSWLLWSTTSIGGLQVSPETVSANFLAINLIISQLGKSSSLS